MSSSPWGTIDHVSRFERGVSFVSTPSHGGLRVSRGYAERHLTDACRKRAIRQGAYYFWEEDCLYCVAMLELSHLWDKVGGNLNREDLLSNLSSWNPDYLLEVGIQPIEPQYSNWLAWRRVEEMYAKKDPNLITGALSLNDTYVRVWTADGQEHIVKAESYQPCTPNLLSACQRVPILP